MEGGSAVAAVRIWCRQLPGCRINFRFQTTSELSWEKWTVNGALQCSRNCTALHQNYCGSHVTVIELKHFKGQL